MDLAIKIAKESSQRGDYAFGSVIVRSGFVLAAAGNRVLTYRDPTAHAELRCVQKAARLEGARHLGVGAVLVSTAAPCPMCLGAACWAKLSGVIYGVSQRDIENHSKTKTDSASTKLWRSVAQNPEQFYESVMKPAHPDLWIIGGFMWEDCNQLFHW